MNSTENRSHQPKGGMCENCMKFLNDCSNLKFDAMPVIGEKENGIKIVRCTEYVRFLQNRNKQQKEI